MLRGPQTPGELRGRTERMHNFTKISDVLTGLQKLMEREPPLAAVLPRQPGTKESRYAHLLSGPVESMQEAASEVAACVCDESIMDAGQNDRISQLEASVADLQREVGVLRERIDSLLR